MKVLSKGNDDLEQPKPRDESKLILEIQTTVEDKEFTDRDQLSREEDAGLFTRWAGRGFCAGARTRAGF